MRLRHRALPMALLAATICLFSPGEADSQPGKGGFGGPGGQKRQLVSKFDKDGDGKLNADERAAAREWLKENGGGGGPFGKGGFGKGKGGWGKGKGREPGKPGPKVAVADVKPADAKKPMYDPGTLRTFFLEFDNKKDWEAELADFYRTDVEVPATLVVDGRKYPGVGVRFRGMSSYFSVPAGLKRSMNISVDFTDKKQRVQGQKTLNLLNSNDDPSMLHTILYSQAVNARIPAPKANLVRVVINGESWGVYVNAQQFNKEFVKEAFKDKGGARWKVQGSPGGRGGLEYLGDDAAAYKRAFTIKSADDPKAWKALIELCKTLNQTPPDKLEKALAPMLDIEGALWFLAYDCVMVNGDGYWTRASDYSLYRDSKGRFHLVPHDMNETFSPGGGGPPGGFQPMKPGLLMPPFLADMLEMDADQKKKLDALQKEVDEELAKLLTPEQRKRLEAGPGGFGPPGGGPGGIQLDPLVGLTNSRMPLRSKLLAVPALKKRYLEMVRQIALEQLDWKKLGPVVASFRALAEKEVEADTRKLYSLAAWKAATDDKPSTRPNESLRAFVEMRAKHLLSHPEIKKLGD
ncbi:MAG: CotH kinase family protein [Gemmataceae bacterium]|nr:CotH kinase family protein [Gemmataceae bacterium]